MIARLTGTVVEILPLNIILEVHDVGYLVAVRQPTAFSVGNTATLYTHLAVRENALDLYGFTLRDELSMFAHLLTIPKVGPKTAMQILSQADVALLTTAIVKNDAQYLSKMSGISKKTAEKIVVELQSKFDDVVLTSGESGVHGEDADIVDALIALGYSQKDARDALVRITPETVGTNARIKEALRLLGK